MTNTTIDSIKGDVKTVTYFNEENGYFVVKVTVPSSKNEITVLGNSPSIHVGESISAKGTWIRNSQWGPQFKATEVVLTHPNSNDGIERFLVSSVEGVGKSFAKKLVSIFGADIFDVIEKSPEKLSKIQGIGKKRVDSLIASYNSQKSIREIMVFLFECGLTSSRAQKIYEKYGDQSIATIKKNPYVLCRDLWGFGFATADEVAKSQGIKDSNPDRVRAGLLHVLGEFVGQGTCGVPMPKLREACAELLSVPLEDIDLAIRAEISGREVVKDFVSLTDQNGNPVDIECLFLSKIYKAEIHIADRLLHLASRPPVKPILNIDAIIAQSETDLKIELDPTQREAVKVALANQVCVITGGPGTGKSTITKVILHSFEKAGLKSITLCAPTGKASKRMMEATNRPASTIHRTLGIDKSGRFKFNRSNPIESDVFLSDEFSMADVFIASGVVDAISVTSRLIIIGDVDQLPSVGPGKVLSDIISSNALPTIKLTKIFRQAATSDIIKYAHAINNGQFLKPSDDPNSDFKMILKDPIDPDDDMEKRQLREESLNRIVKSVFFCKSKYGFNPIRDVQVLAPMRKGVLGIENINIVLQEKLNPRGVAQGIEAFGSKWGVGDKVMQMVNNYDKDVLNGDVGYIKSIDKANKKVVIEFDIGDVTYMVSELSELNLAYAFSIHKSQGSEFPVALLTIDTSHWMMLKRNLLYTGVTRAKKLCVVFGSKTAVRKCIKSDQNDDRVTKLKEWLEKGVPSEFLKYTNE